jgi:hypothetical protein
MTNSVVAWSSTNNYNTSISSLSDITQNTIGGENEPKRDNCTKILGLKATCTSIVPGREYCLSIKQVRPRIVATPDSSTNQRNIPNLDSKHSNIKHTPPRYNTKPKHSIMPSFEDCPPEIRNLIYELALVSDEPISFGNIGAYENVDPPNTSNVVTNHLKTYLPLTQVSRQLREETTPMLFGRNTFEVVLSTKKTRGPLTQVGRQLRSKRKFREFDLDSSKTSPGTLTYGDAEAAAWTRVASDAALSWIEHLSIVIENADSVSRWHHLRHLYKTPIDSGEKKPGVFSPKSWFDHVIDAGNKSCNRFTIATWSIDLEQRQIRRTDIARTLPDKQRSQKMPKPCLKCKNMMKDWGREFTTSGDILTRGHLLKLVWYDSRIITLERSQKLTVSS